MLPLQIGQHYTVPTSAAGSLGLSSVPAASTSSPLNRGWNCRQSRGGNTGRQVSAPAPIRRGTAAAAGTIPTQLVVPARTSKRPTSAQAAWGCAVCCWWAQASAEGSCSAVAAQYNARWPATAVIEEWGCCSSRPTPPESCLHSAASILMLARSLTDMNKPTTAASSTFKGCGMH